MYLTCCSSGCGGRIFLFSTDRTNNRRRTRFHGSNPKCNRPPCSNIQRSFRARFRFGLLRRCFCYPGRGDPEERCLGRQRYGVVLDDVGVDVGNRGRGGSALVGWAGLGLEGRSDAGVADLPEGTVALTTAEEVGNQEVAMAVGCPQTAVCVAVAYVAGPCS